MEDIEEAYEEIENRNFSAAPLKRRFMEEDREAGYGSFRYVHRPAEQSGNGYQKIIHGGAEIREPSLPHDGWHSFAALALMTYGLGIRESAATVWGDDREGSITDPDYPITNPKARRFVEDLEKELGEDGKFGEEEQEELDELLWNEVYEESELP